MNGDAIPSVARTISDISDRFSLADPLLIADIALNITNVLLSIRWICPYISRHLLSLNPLLARCRR
ncbi:hypothetical protein EI041_26645, partial [Escherichia coli]|nr:hypothetical protein [Escherichia coli]